MATVRVERSISPNSAFGRQIAASVAKQTAARLIGVAAEAERMTDVIVANEFVNDRSPDRRRPGAHLLGSFRCKIVHNGFGFPMYLVMTSIAPGAKVNSLEGGSKAHTIPGPVVFPVAQRWSAAGASAASPRAGRFRAAYTKNKAGSPTVKAPEVKAPALAAHHFMRRGLEQAVRAAYGRAVAAGR